MIYLMGALRNPALAEAAMMLRARGLVVFDDWRGAHPDADDVWRDYERARGRDYIDALNAPFATAVFDLDRRYLDRADVGVLVLPAGKSAFAELGYLIGRGKPVYVILPEEPDRWDFMLKFATHIYPSMTALMEAWDEHQ